MSALRPGTDRQEEEEPQPGAAGNTAGPLTRGEAKAGGAARRVGGWRRAGPARGVRALARLQLPPRVKAQGAARPGGAP